MAIPASLVTRYCAVLALARATSFIIICILNNHGNRNIGLILIISKANSTSAMAIVAASAMSMVVFHGHILGATHGA
jgi:hypothetical protein